MIKLYYEEPYLKETEATITAIEGNRVFFDKSIFYPEGGGQPGDIGTFGIYRIIDTQKAGEESAHIFNDTEGLKVGQKGVLKLDWEHRYAFMKRHSAQHLLSSVFFKTLGAGTLAVHLGDEYVTIELDRKDIEEKELLRVEEIANFLVRQSLKIEQKDLLRSEAEALHMRRSIKVSDEVVKVVFIECQDAVACGGVHLSNTNEIGEISFYDVEHIRGHVRTIWLIDSQAEKTRRENLSIVKELSTLLSAPREEIIDALKARLDEADGLKHSMRTLYSSMARKEALLISDDYSIHFTDLPLDEFRSVLSSENKRRDVLILRDGEKKEFLYIGDEGHFTELKKILSLKGGGRNGIYQGSFLEDCKAIAALAKGVIDGFKG